MIFVTSITNSACVNFFLTLGKISHGEEIYCVISKIFLKFLMLIWISEESTYFKRTVSEYHIFGVQMQKIGFLEVKNVAVYAFFGKFSYFLKSGSCKRFDKYHVWVGDVEL